MEIKDPVNLQLYRFYIVVCILVQMKISKHQLKRPGTRCRCLLIFFSVLIIADLVFFFCMPLGALFPGIASRPLPSYAAGAVLFHDFKNDLGGIDNETKRRVNHAIDLFQQGKLQYIIFAGGNRRKKKNLQGSQFMADYALSQKIPAEKIFIEQESKDTMGNLAGIKKIMVREGLNSLVLISSPYHLERLELIARDELSDLALSPYDFRTCDPPFTRKEIWHAAHYNFVALLAKKVMPEKVYAGAVRWIRENTTF